MLLWRYRSLGGLAGPARGLKIYAIVETGGKQYKVTSGQVIDVESLGVAEGSTIEIDRVLLIADGDKVTVGTPTVDGAKVLATSQGDDRSEKVIVFKYKNKTRYSKKTGHRQPYTRLTIDKIMGPGIAEGEPIRQAQGEPIRPFDPSTLLRAGKAQDKQAQDEPVRQAQDKPVKRTRRRKSEVTESGA